jgi:hypothetical protein
MDWTEFDADGQATIMLSLMTRHGGAVAKCVEIRFGVASADEDIGSSCQVNALRDGLLGKRLPTIDFAHADLA